MPIYIKRLFFDIETIPASEEKREIFLEILKERAKKLNQEDIDEEKLYKDTALEGTFGRICCIAAVAENSDNTLEQQIICNAQEETMLQEFWEIARRTRVFVGHNILEFDLPFIYKRSFIFGINPKKEIKLAKFKTEEIFDTEKEWEKWAYNKRQKLDTLAKVLGLHTSKDKMDGSEVWEYYQQGKIQDICEYCMKDAMLTREVYYKMTFQPIPSM